MPLNDSHLGVGGRVERIKDAVPTTGPVKADNKSVTRWRPLTRRPSDFYRHAIG
jgi:hypothetical protein